MVSNTKGFDEQELIDMTSDMAKNFAKAQTSRCPWGVLKAGIGFDKKCIDHDCDYLKVAGEGLTHWYECECEGGE
jgi:hypothetical protein